MCEYQSESVTELAEILISVQHNLQPALKDASNPFTKSTYTSPNYSMMEFCREVLLRYGAGLTQLPVPAPEHPGGGDIGLLARLTHAESGQYQPSLMVVPLPPDVAAGLNGVLKGAPLCLPENGGEIISPHLMFRIACTGNTNGGGDNTGLHQGTGR